MAERAAPEPAPGASSGHGQMSSAPLTRDTRPAGSPAPAGEPPASQATVAVRLEHARAQIGRHLVWSEVGMAIAQGEFAAILGPNGSGKTTLLRVLLGELALTHGTASILGKPPGALKG